MEDQSISKDAKEDIQAGQLLLNTIQDLGPVAQIVNFSDRIRIRQIFIFRRGGICGIQAFLRPIGSQETDHETNGPLLLFNSNVFHPAGTAETSNSHTCKETARRTPDHRADLG